MRQIVIDEDGIELLAMFAQPTFGEHMCVRHGRFVRAELRPDLLDLSARVPEFLQRWLHDLEPLIHLGKQSRAGLKPGDESAKDRRRHRSIGLHFLAKQRLGFLRSAREGEGESEAHHEQYDIDCFHRLTVLIGTLRCGSENAVTRIENVATGSLPALQFGLAQGAQVSATGCGYRQTGSCRPRINSLADGFGNDNSLYR